VFVGGFLLIHRAVHSPFGQVLKAIRENEARALSLGYDVNRYKLLAYVLSADARGPRGCDQVLVFELASLTDVHWTMSGEVVLMVLLEGLGPCSGRWWRPDIISMENYLAQIGSWVTVVQGVIFVICVLTFRRGVIGRAEPVDREAAVESKTRVEPELDAGSVSRTATANGRKLRMSCLELSRRLLNLAITPFASEPELECAWIACTRSKVLPSCRKKMRCPKPQSGAVRNSLGQPAPERLRRPARRPCRTRTSENRFAVVAQRRDRGITGRERGRVTEGATDAAEQLLPFAMDVAPPGVSGEGVGGARKRMKNENFSMSLIASRAAGAVVSVMLFGTVANWQLGVSSRSVWNSSLVTPCSTLYASPEKAARLVLRLPSEPCDGARRCRCDSSCR